MKTFKFLGQSIIITPILLGCGVSTQFSVLCIGLSGENANPSFRDSKASLPLIERTGKLFVEYHHTICRYSWQIATTLRYSWAVSTSPGVARGPPLLFEALSDAKSREVCNGYRLPAVPLLMRANKSTSTSAVVNALRLLQVYIDNYNYPREKSRCNFVGPHQPR